ncbi:D-glutamate cyclase family protein [Campylobacter coli]
MVTLNLIGSNSSSAYRSGSFLAWKLIKEGEIPVFWACGVTPQNVIMKAKLPFVITHAPGHMFISDILNSSLKS